MPRHKPSVHDSTARETAALSVLDIQVMSAEIEAFRKEYAPKLLAEIESSRKELLPKLLAEIEASRKELFPKL